MFDVASGACDILRIASCCSIIVFTSRERGVELKR